MGLSTFSSLNIAARGLDAARHQIAITGQNTANANTVGYTRQSVGLSSVAGTNGPGLAPGPAGPGQGVAVSSLDRSASELLNRQVRGAAATAGFAQVRAETYSTIEDVLREPGDQSVSTVINSFFTAWQGLANDPGAEATSAVLVQATSNLAGRINADHQHLTGQWEAQHSALRADLEQTNVLAGRLASINNSIRQSVANGGNANELKDARDQVAEQLTVLTGGQLRASADGTADFLVGGNALVGADGTVRELVTDPTVQPGDQIAVTWSHRPGSAGVDGGTIAGRLSVLNPSGPLVTAMTAYDDLAVAVADQVNAIHATGVTADGTPGAPVFSYDPTRKAASLTSLLSSPDQVAHAAPGAGNLDGSTADKVSQLNTGLSRQWSGFVTATGASSRSSLDAFSLAVTSEGSARASQQSMSSVDLDEEAVNLVTFQHAYQASARILTAVDEMLDVLINRTGLVGR